jgi:hypothetical protein
LPDLSITPWFSVHFPVVNVYQSVFSILKMAQQTESSQAQKVTECEEKSDVSIAKRANKL